MCIICLEIDKGIYTNMQELNSMYGALELISLGEHFHEIYKKISEKEVPINKESLIKNACICGAKYTSFPKHHLKYCGDSLC